MNLASRKPQWPLGRGFERFYGFLGAETNQWYPDLVYDNHPVEQPAHARGGLPPHRRPHRQGARVHPRRQGRRARTSRSSCTTARARATPRITLPRSGPTSTRASSTWATRRTASSSSAAEADGHRHRLSAELSPINPYAGQTSADGQTWPEADTARPWDSPHRRREAAVHAHGRGVRGLPRLTPTTRSGGCWITSSRAASWTTRSSSSCRTTAPPARAARTGRSTRTNSSTGSRTRSRQNLPRLDDLGSPATYNHYPTGWAGRSTPRSRCGSGTRTSRAARPTR